MKIKQTLLQFRQTMLDERPQKRGQHDIHQPIKYRNVPRTLDERLLSYALNEVDQRVQIYARVLNFRKLNPFSLRFKGTPVAFECVAKDYLTPDGYLDPKNPPRIGLFAATSLNDYSEEEVAIRVDSFSDESAVNSLRAQAQADLGDGYLLTIRDNDGYTGALLLSTLETRYADSNKCPGSVYYSFSWPEHPADVGLSKVPRLSSRLIPEILLDVADDAASADHRIFKADFDFTCHYFAARRVQDDLYDLLDIRKGEKATLHVGSQMVNASGEILFQSSKGIISRLIP